MGLKIMLKTCGNIIDSSDGASRIFICLNSTIVHQSQVFPLKRAKKGIKWPISGSARYDQ